MMQGGDSLMGHEAQQSGQNGGGSGANSRNERSSSGGSIPEAYQRWAPRQQGYLYKNDSAGYMWHKRWCVLRGPVMLYYVTHTDPQPRGAVVLEGAKLFHPLSRYLSKSPIKKLTLEDKAGSNMFAIVTADNRTFRFGAKTPEKLELWTNALLSTGVIEKAAESVPAVAAPIPAEMTSVPGAEAHKTKPTDFQPGQSQMGEGENVDEVYRERLIAFYQKNNPAKLDQVDEVLQDYKGREEELFANLEKKYGAPVEPISVEALNRLSSRDMNDRAQRAGGGEENQSQRMNTPVAVPVEEGGKGQKMGGAKSCPQCSQELPTVANFCNKCGTAIHA